MNIRIMIADDHLPYRAVLRGLLEKQVNLQIVGQANESALQNRLASRSTE